MARLESFYRAVLVTPCEFFAQFLKEKCMTNPYECLSDELDVKERISDVLIEYQDYIWETESWDRPSDYLRADELEFQISRVYKLDSKY